jgi:hypothetical protein
VKIHKSDIFFIREVNCNSLLTEPWEVRKTPEGGILARTIH